MQNNSVESKYYSGQGIVLIGERDPETGKILGYRNIGNVSSLELTIEVSNLEHKESSTGQRATDKRLTTEQKANIAMTMESIKKENLALALRGDASAVVGAAVADEAITAYLGLTVPLANINLDPEVAIVVKGTGDDAAVTYELNKNYTVNEAVGSINFLTAAEQTAAGAVASIADGAELVVSYTHLGFDRVNAMTQGAKAYALRFEGLNTADTNKPVVVDIFKFESDPLQNLALINDEIANMSLAGSALADQTRTSGSKFFEERIA